MYTGFETDVQTFLSSSTGQQKIRSVEYKDLITNTPNFTKAQCLEQTDRHFQSLYHKRKLNMKTTDFSKGQAKYNTVRR